MAEGCLLHVHCTIKQMSSKMYQHQLWEEDCESGWYGLYDRNTVEEPLLRKQSDIKRPQWAKAHKDWNTEQWNKVPWTDESKFEIFGSNWRVYVRWIVGERAAIPCITATVKNGGGSALIEGLQLQSRVFAAGEEQIESDRLSQHTAASRDPIWNATAFESRICTHVT